MLAAPLAVCPPVGAVSGQALRRLLCRLLMASRRAWAGGRVASDQSEDLDSMLCVVTQQGWTRVPTGSGSGVSDALVQTVAKPVG